jgi:hypothetical protein
MRASASAAADCPVAAPSRETTYARALHRACLILGGLAQLADHLKVPDAQLQSWLQGREDPPESVFFAAVEIILLYAEDVRGAG